jgi:DNA-binding response OmpR family regulator
VVKKLEKTILVIEPEPVIRKLYGMIFKGTAYTLIMVAYGAEALQCLRDPKISLILLELELPDMSSHLFLTKLSELTPNIPVIVVSSYPENVDKYPQVMARLPKPFYYLHLLAVIGEHLL